MSERETLEHSKGKRRSRAEDVSRTQSKNAVELALMWGFYAAMVLCNGLFETLRLGGTTANEVATEVFTWFMPAGYTFSIWGLIYIGLAVWLVRYTLNSPVRRKEISMEAKLFVASCILNVAWLALFHYDLVLASLFAAIGLWAVLIALYQQVRDSSQDTFDRVPISLYAAWSTVAVVINATSLITRFLDGGIPIANGIGAVLLAAGVLALGYALYRRFDDIVFPIVMVWAVVGVGVNLLLVSILVSVAMFVMATFYAAALIIYILVGRPVPIAH